MVTRNLRDFPAGTPRVHIVPVWDKSRIFFRHPPAARLSPCIRLNFACIPRMFSRQTLYRSRFHPHAKKSVLEETGGSYGMKETAVQIILHRCVQSLMPKASILGKSPILGLSGSGSCGKSYAG